MESLNKACTLNKLMSYLKYMPVEERIAYGKLIQSLRETHK